MHDNQINLTLGEVLAIYQAIGQISSVKDDGLRYNVAKAKRILTKEAELYEEQRNQIIIELSPEHHDLNKESVLTREAFLKRDKALRGTKIELPGLLRFSRQQAMCLTDNPHVLESLLLITTE